MASKKNLRNKKMKSSIKIINFIYKGDSFREKITESKFIENFKNALTESKGTEIKPIINTIINSKIGKKYLAFTDFNINSLGKRNKLNNLGDRYKELAFISEILSIFKEDIKYFSEKSDIYHTLYLNGEINNAMSVLDEIENKLGVSIWSIESRIYCEYEKNGAEATKDLCKNYKELNSSGLIRYLISFFSRK